MNTCPTQTCPACKACPTQVYPPMVTRQDLLNVLNTMPNFGYKSLTTRTEMENALNDPNLILPQDIPSLSPTTVANLTDAQTFAIFIGYMALFSKVNFTLTQLEALTPAIIKSNVDLDFMIAYTAGVIIQAGDMGSLSSVQLDAINNLSSR